MKATMQWDCGQAIKALKDGMRVRREGWNGKGMWLKLRRPAENSKMGHPYIYMSDIHGKLFPWNPNALDMLAEDWEVIDAEGNALCQALYIGSFYDDKPIEMRITTDYYPAAMGFHGAHPSAMIKRITINGDELDAARTSGFYEEGSNEVDLRGLKLKAGDTVIVEVEAVKDAAVNAAIYGYKLDADEGGSEEGP